MRLIIFDMDGTLYDLADVVQMSYDMQVEFLSEKRSIKRAEAISYLSDNHVYPEMKKDSKSATELFLQMGFDKKEWSDFRNAGFDVTKIDKKKAVDENTMFLFSEIAPIVLLSSNTYKIIEKILNHINISTSLFDTIICSDRFPYESSFKKKLAMEYLMDKYSVNNMDTLSIGDRYNTDIAPILEIGGKGILVKSPKFLLDVLADLRSGDLKTCDRYEYYNK